MNLLAYNCIFNRPNIADSHQKVSFAGSFLKANADDSKRRQFSVYNANNVLCRIYFIYQHYFGNNELLVCHGEKGDFYIDSNEYLRALVVGGYSTENERDVDFLLMRLYQKRISPDWKQCTAFMQDASEASDGFRSFYGHRAVSEKVLSQTPHWFATRSWDPIDFRADMDARVLEEHDFIGGNTDEEIARVEDRCRHFNSAFFIAQADQILKEAKDFSALLSGDDLTALQAAMAQVDTYRNVNQASFAFTSSERDRVQKLCDGFDAIYAITVNATLSRELEFFEPLTTLFDKNYLHLWARFKPVGEKTFSEIEDCMIALKKDFYSELPTLHVQEAEAYIEAYFTDEKLELIDYDAFKTFLSENKTQIKISLKRKARELIQAKQGYDAEASVLREKGLKLQKSVQSYRGYITQLGITRLKNLLKAEEGVSMPRSHVTPCTYLKDLDDETPLLPYASIYDISIPAIEGLEQLKINDESVKIEFRRRFQDKFDPINALERLNLKSVFIAGQALLSADGTRANFRNSKHNEMWVQLCKEDPTDENVKRLKASLCLVAFMDTLKFFVQKELCVSVEDSTKVAYNELAALFMIDINPASIKVAELLTVPYMDVRYGSGYSCSRRYDISAPKDKESALKVLTFEMTLEGNIIFNEGEMLKVVTQSQQKRVNTHEYPHDSDYQGFVKITTV